MITNRIKVLLRQKQLRFLSTLISTDLSNACDCHVHIVDSSLEKFPQVPDRLYTAAPAPLVTLQKLASPLGIHRFVLVQPSFYGTDNHCLLQALDQLGYNNGRGIVVIDPKTTELSQLKDLHKKGVRGVRINLYSRLKNSSDHSNENFDEQLINLVKQMNNWHIQLFASMKTINRMAEQIKQIAPLPIVLDHYGMPDDYTSSSEIHTFLDLIHSQSHMWIKLSAPYRLPKTNPLETRPSKQWLQPIIKNLPDRCVWGSDWPHTPDQNVTSEGIKQQTILPYRSIDYQQLYENFANSINNSDLIQKIFVTNPQKLYDF
jgi:predicted TIM-barrel fold metal-dependent hydrolase